MRSPTSTSWYATHSNPHAHTQANGAFCTQARSDPSFNLADTPLAVQPFTNPGAYQHPGSDANVNAIPHSSSPARSVDGYTSDALLLVAEQFANTRAPREPRIGALMFEPVVR